MVIIYKFNKIVCIFSQNDFKYPQFFFLNLGQMTKVIVCSLDFENLSPYLNSSIFVFHFQFSVFLFQLLSNFINCIFRFNPSNFVRFTALFLKSESNVSFCKSCQSFFVKSSKERVGVKRSS